MGGGDRDSHGSPFSRREEETGLSEILFSFPLIPSLPPSSYLVLSLSFSRLSIVPSFHTPPFLPSFCIFIPSTWTETERDWLQEHFQWPPGIEGRRTLLQPTHRHPSWGLAQWTPPSPHQVVVLQPGGLQHGLACQARTL